MAINKAVNSPAKSHGGMRNCIEYVLKDEKVKDGYVDVTGPYDHEEITYDKVYKTFLDEKKTWDKDSGRMYNHNVISFPPEENISAERALEIGKKFTEKFYSGFQTLIAVHQDRAHIHIHLVTNTVSFENGAKLHTKKTDLAKMKTYTNQLCKEQGLSVPEKGKTYDGRDRAPGEITSWSKDFYNLAKQKHKPSYVAKLAMDIVSAKRECKSESEFANVMREKGWIVKDRKKGENYSFSKAEEKRTIRDTTLARTFNLNITKEGLVNEFDRNSRRYISGEIERRKRELEESSRRTSGPDRTGRGKSENSSSGKVQGRERVGESTRQTGRDHGSFGRVR